LISRVAQISSNVELALSHWSWSLSSLHCRCRLQLTPMWGSSSCSPPCLYVTRCRTCAIIYAWSNSGEVFSQIMSLFLADSSAAACLACMFHEILLSIHRAIWPRYSS
jgi:hypothetical protein